MIQIKSGASNFPKSFASTCTPQAFEGNGHHVAYAPKKNPIQLDQVE